MSRRAAAAAAVITAPETAGALAPRVVLLVPRRNDSGERDRIWAWCRTRWQTVHPDLPIYEGHHTDGLFNRSAAVNKAAELADLDGRWDLAIVIDSDIFIARHQVLAAIERASTTGRVTWAHRRWRGLSEDATQRLVADYAQLELDPFSIDMDLLVEKTNPISWSCCFVVPRAVWDELGGFDERFEGWGFEDMAWQSAVAGLFGHERIEGDIYHCWHPRSGGNGKATRDDDGLHSREAIFNARLGRRYMVAARRDHRVHDRLQPSDAAEFERDIANLKHDDQRLAADAQRLAMPDWSEWWPTLPELVAGAREHRESRAIAGRTVTVVVHTGGVRGAWPERRAYLERSIESLAQQVSGPIVQRVIYDCWGDPEIREWLSDRFGAHGFYVVGPTSRPTYTEGMQLMWSYLARRARGSFVLQVEDDFVYDRPVDLLPMIDALEEDTSLSQMALLRGPFYPREIAAGGIVEEHPEAYEARSHDGHPYLAHRLYFTANPCLFRRALADAKPWPSGQHSETLYTNQLNQRGENRFGIWGSGEPWITHLGERKAAEGGY